MRKIIIFLHCLACLAMVDLLGASSAQQIVFSMREVGYYEFCNEYLTKEFYKEVYQIFEHFLREMDIDPSLCEQFKKIEKQFVLTDAFPYSGKSPIGLINSDKSGKQDKIYYHFSKEFLQFIQCHSPDLLKNKNCSEFFYKLAKIDEVSNLYLKQYIEQLKEIFPSLPEVMLKKGELPIIIKVIRYEVNKGYVGSPHYDYSGLTLLLDNSDIGKESLFIAPYSDHLNWCHFHRPIRYVCAEGTSVLLISGLGLPLSGIDLMPPPHVVLRRNNIRYAVIAFGMVPDLEVTTDQIRIKKVAGKVPEDD